MNGLMLYFQAYSLDIAQIRQVRYSTRIMINVKLNYIPRDLLQSKACNDRCKSVVTVNMVSGDFLDINS